MSKDKSAHTAPIWGDQGEPGVLGVCREEIPEPTFTSYKVLGFPKHSLGKNGDRAIDIQTDREYVKVNGDWKRKALAGGVI